MRSRGLSSDSSYADSNQNGGNSQGHADCDGGSNHGPASQGSATEADSCFARVIGGEQVVQRLFKKWGRKQNGNPAGFISDNQQHATIKSFKMLSARVATRWLPSAWASFTFCGMHTLCHTLTICQFGTLVKQHSSLALFVLLEQPRRILSQHVHLRTCQVKLGAGSRCGCSRWNCCDV